MAINIEPRFERVNHSRLRSGFSIQIAGLVMQLMTNKILLAAQPRKIDADDFHMSFLSSVLSLESSETVLHISFAPL